MGQNRSQIRVFANLCLSWEHSSHRRLPVVIQGSAQSGPSLENKGCSELSQSSTTSPCLWLRTTPQGPFLQLCAHTGAPAVWSEGPATEQTCSVCHGLTAHVPGSQVDPRSLHSALSPLLARPQRLASSFSASEKQAISSY